MAKLAEYERYMEYLCEALGHQDRHAGFSDYSRGLMLPIERKSVEPLAAHIDPLHVSAKHQSLHHVVADSEWSDVAVLRRVRGWVMPELGRNSKFYWIVDDTGFPKKGTYSVGVARQDRGQLGKQDNCQVAVSLSLASERGSLPIDWRLYLPKEWAKDQKRRGKAGVPKAVKFLTKPGIALEQIRAAKAAGVPIGIVLADAGYGNERRGVKRSMGWNCNIVWEYSRSPRCGRPDRRLCPPRPKKRPSRHTVAACGGQHTAQCDGGGRNLASPAMAHGALARGNQPALVLALCRSASAGSASRRGRAARFACRAMVVDRMACRSSRTDQVLAGDLARHNGAGAIGQNGQDALAH